MSMTQEQARIKVGDFVRVVSGPAYVKGHTIKGRVEEVTPTGDDAEVMVRVASGGLWGFQARHLAILPKRPNYVADLAGEGLL